MSALERVDGWRTSDGRIFPRSLQEDAELHQHKLDFAAWFSNNICIDGDEKAAVDAIWSAWSITPKLSEVENGD